MKKALFAVAGSLALLAASQNAYAQGCVLIREAAPVIGSSSSTYLHPGEWQLDISYRDSTADKHYSLDVEQTQRSLRLTRWFCVLQYKQTLPLETRHESPPNLVDLRQSMVAAVAVPRCCNDLP